MMIFDWFRESTAHRDAITADAEALIEEHGQDALSEARYLAMREYEGGPLGDRPRGYWGEVRDEVRRLTQGH
jgi:hypothetical protein